MRGWGQQQGRGILLKHLALVTQSLHAFRNFLQPAIRKSDSQNDFGGSDSGVHF